MAGSSGWQRENRQANLRRRIRVIAMSSATARVIVLDTRIARYRHA
jgi:hypothetical protein